MRRGNREKQLEIDFSAEPPGEWAEGQLALKEMLLHSYTQKMKSPSPRVRARGARGLGELGAIARCTIPDLTKLLADPDQKVRECAAQALARLRPL